MLRHLFGRLTYRGRCVYGFKATGTGSPLDSYGQDDIGAYDDAVQRQMQSLERSWGEPKCRN